MVLRIGFVALITTASLLSDACAQDISQRGVIVESVISGFQANRAGLRSGDIVQTWTREKAKGKIDSPFDLLWVEAEQGPRGEVMLEGLRNNVRRLWRIGGGRWHLVTRPSLPRVLLTVYREGRHLIQEGKPLAGAARWREGAEEAESLRLNLVAAWLQFQSAGVLLSNGQREEGDASYRRSIHLAAGAGSQIKSQLLRECATSYAKRSDFEKAEELAREALAESHGLNDLSTSASLRILGSLSFYRWQLDEAERYYKSAMAIIDSVAPKSMDAGITLDNLGNVAQRRGEFKKAEVFYRQGLAILSDFPPEGVEVTWGLLGLSVVSARHGDLGLAEDFLQKVIALQRRLVPNSLDVATSLTNLGLLHFERGDLAQADHYLHQGLALRERIAPGSIFVAESLTNLGATALERGNWAEAEEDHKQALAIKQRLAPGSVDLADDLNNLGVIASKREDLAGAEDYHQRALAIREKLLPDSLECAESLQNLGEVAQSEDDLDKAEAYYRRGLAIRERVAPNTTMHAESLAALASAKKKRGDLEAAAQLFDKALAVLEAQIARLGGGEQTRLGFREKHLTYYQDYVDVLMQTRKPELAFHVVERCRARSLLEMLSESHADVHAGVDPDLLREERSLQGLIAAQSNWLVSSKRSEVKVDALHKELDENINKYRELEDKIRRTSPVYAALTRPQPLTAAEVQQQLLDEDTLLLEYSLGEERSYAWIISQAHVSSHELAKRSEIEAAAQRLYRLLTARNQQPAGETRVQREARWVQSEKEYASAAAELSRLVLGPLTGELKQKRLMVVSDGALQYIPFALLPAARTSDGFWPEKPLVAEHEIVNLPSASVFAVLRNDARMHSRHPKMLAVLADPVFSEQDARIRALGGSLDTQRKKAGSLRGEALTRAAADLALPHDEGWYLPRLPFTQREARAIMTTVPNGQGIARLGFDANRAQATARALANYRVVHFATHALLDNNHAELSGLVFSLLDRNGRDQDGFVEMQDVYNLDLPVDLVVLSACETGLGTNIKGEGLMGLTRGFMYAGAKRVLASLWSVDDVATSELMRRFYEAMFREQMSPPAALRKAQLQMLQDERWHSPYYWAAFVLQGESKPIAE
jgi:CHAT domain-containing protein/Tfp pilus assembly protein PilF